MSDEEKIMIHERRKIYIILVSFILFINVSLIFNNNVWCDEAFILNGCKLGFKELLKYIAVEDKRPPLYLLSAKIWSMCFGLSVPSLKIFSIIPAILTILVDGKIIWNRYGFKSSVIFCMLVGLSPAGITKNIEITIYSWTLFWVTTSVLLAFEIYKRPQKHKNKIFFIIAGLGAAATHYYALLAEIFIYGALFLSLIIKYKNKQSILNVLSISIITIIGYIPCLPFFLRQFADASGSFWITDVTLSTIVSSQRMPFEGENAFTFSNEFTALFWIMNVFLFINLLNKRDRKSGEKDKTYFAILCFILLLVIPISGYVFSRIIRPLYISRYFYCVAGVLWTFSAISFSILKLNKYIFRLIISAIIVMFIFDYPVIFEREYETETQAAVDLVNESLEKDDIFVNNIEECASWELEYYFPGHKYYLNNDQGIYYKDQLFDFSNLDTTAWYFCRGELDITEDQLVDWKLSCEFVGIGNFDNYYYCYIYKLIPY